jgi:hypothetical protein
MPVKLGCVACNENRCQVHGYVYHCVIVSLLDKTFDIELVQHNKEMPTKEQLGMFGFGQRFKTVEDQTEFIEYLERNGFQYKSI